VVVAALKLPTVLVLTIFGPIVVVSVPLVVVVVAALKLPTVFVVKISGPKLVAATVSV
jgi:hypothetical protein